jgi:hypothetical protein
MEGLQAGRQEGVKELADLWEYVKHLEDQLHKVGSWRVAKVTQARVEDSSTIREQTVRTQVRGSIPGCPASATYTPAPVQSQIRSDKSKCAAVRHSGCTDPWGSISRRRGCHFRSRIHTSQSNFHSRITGYVRYTIPPLRPTFVTDFMSSSLSFPARLFSRIFDRDKGVATREGGTWSSGLRVPGIL